MNESGKHKVGKTGKAAPHSQFNMFLLLCSQPACWSIYPSFVTDSKNIAWKSSLWNWPSPLLLFLQFAMSHTPSSSFPKHTFHVPLSDGQSRLSSRGRAANGVLLHHMTNCYPIVLISGAVCFVLRSFVFSCPQKFQNSALRNCSSLLICGDFKISVRLKTRAINSKKFRAQHEEHDWF